MAIAVGTRLGPYEILGPLGSGGMGEVYRARDNRLNRDVAIKVLPAAVAGDAERLARFRREAQLLAALNHPHVGAIYGFEDANGVGALVLELVEGETLADRIRRGAIPNHEALAIARQIAEALEAAHEKGIVHRDLKPANIKITPEGIVKVLDFGLAKAAGIGEGRDLSQSPTVTGDDTRDGVTLGTAVYMSPEQARGQQVDKRTDIWAFGCVLYELLTGRMAFSGATLADVLAAVLEREPDWSRLPAATPPMVRRVLHRCLEKDPRRRLRDIADARVDLEDAEHADPTVQRPLPKFKARARIGFALAALVGAFAIVLAILYWTPQPALEPMRLSVAAPGPFTPPFFIALSPDGRQLAFVAPDSSGKPVLWVRALDAAEPRVLAGTEDAAHPFWSPDSRSLGFFAEGKLKRVDAAGGSVQTLAEPAMRAGGSWNHDGIVLFVRPGAGLARVSASGGTMSPVIVRDSAGQEIPSPGWPRFLPDGRHFLFYGRGDDRGAYVGSLDASDAKFLVRTEFKAAYAPGYLLFMRDDHALMAQPFDAGRLVLNGDPSLITERVFGVKGAAHNAFSVSDNGVLAFLGVLTGQAQMALYDRSGRRLGLIGDRAAVGLSPRFSPDGQRVANAWGEPSDIWIFSVTGGPGVRLTFDAAPNSVPLWSADGSRIVFESRGRAYEKQATGAGSEQPLFEAATGMYLEDWSLDGRYLVYVVSNPVTRRMDLWVAPLIGDRKPFPFLQTGWDQSQAQVSPDGRWIAYTSNETKRNEVYVESFPTRGSKRQVSTQGGVQPRWRRDGTELFYLTLDRKLTAVPVTIGADIRLGAARTVLQTHGASWGTGSFGWRTTYDVTADGQRFLLIQPGEEQPHINVILNWPAALKR